jgi:Effector Associated Constant Component 1
MSVWSRVGDGMSVGVERPLEVLLVLDPDVEADAEEAARLRQRLHAELSGLDVDDVQARRDPASPTGAKSGAGSLMGEWLITISAGGGVLAMVVATIRDWLGRRAGAHRITVTIGEDTIELSAATPVEREALVGAFLRRHAQG